MVLRRGVTRLAAVLLTALLPPLLADADIARTVRAASSRSRTDRSLVVAPGARPAVLAAMALGEEGVQRVAGGDAPSTGSAEVSGTPLLVVTATGREAEETALALRSYLPADDVAVMPAWETLPHERLSPRADTVAQRLSVLRRLAHPEEGGAIRVLIVPVRALLAPVIAGLGELEPVQLAPGLTVGLEETARRLEAAAYTRVDMVESRGEYAVRGGILDVFPPSEPRPVRVDFFGDEIDEVSSFAVADQRTIETLGAVTATACRELVLTDAVRERAAALVDAVPGAADMLEKISQGIAVEGMESLAPVLVEKMVPLLDLVGDRLTVLLEPERVRKRAEDLTATTTEFLAAAWTSAASGGTVPVDLSAAAFAHLAEARALALSSNRGWWSFTALAAGPETTRLDLSDPHTYRGELERAVADLGRLARQGWTVVVATDGPGPGRRMAQLLGDGDVPARIVDQLSEVGELGRDGDWAPDPATPVEDMVDETDADGSAGAPTAGPGDGVVRVTQASAGHGFLAEGLRLALIAESDLTGRASAGPRERRSLPARRARRSVDPLSLHAGDLVVHAQHGVGRFIELSRRTVGGPRSSATREYLVIEYAPSKRGGAPDRLFVPSDQLDLISNYVGGENPSLSKMGGSDWAKTKSRARKAVKEIAADLVKLYSARQASRGHAFAPDTPWQRELEESFPYNETPDQLTAIHEVKEDMEKEIPMDRLISGDVGFGKTEVAVRAAFKAVQDGKQVAVLVPTTLLAQQHYETFTERFSGFPVKIRVLSRFQKAKETRQITEEIASGAVDVVIGTHRILSESIVFKDLGLVIIDEEQRFGVEHKEKLKQMRTNVDVLAMSATPIPRTLEMSLTGIRETSTLATAPEERHPVLTFVGPRTDSQITAAIRRELMREGQVFFVHNRVADIDNVAAEIGKLVPEARIATAHGRMSESRLEQIIVDFWERRFDVLVCTTIVETGLDISNANTLIVDNAQNYGLSQLHQLRGRVGRGRERAYAYFLYPVDKTLGEIAHERLKAVATHNELGAGLQLAMKDLEIRGAGNLLGGEQSGHIAGVGFDLYLRLVGEAVANYRGEKEEREVETKIDLPVNAHIPHTYIDSERLRLQAYRQIAAADTEEKIAEAREELADRYGELPEAVENLLAVATLRMHARAAGIHEMVVLGPKVRVVSAQPLPESRQMRLKRVYPGSTHAQPKGVDTWLTLVPRPKTMPVGGKELVDRPMLEWAEKFINSIYAEKPQALEE